VTRRTVLVAHPSPDLYGSDRVALSAVEALVRHGHRVVVTLPHDGPLVPLVEAAGADVAFCRSPVLRRSALRPSGMVGLLAATVRSVVPGLRLLRSCDPDLVYVSTLTLPLWLVLARLVGRPSMCHVHEAESGVPALVRRALALPLRLCRSIATNSEFSRAVLVSAVPDLRARSQVLPNPVPAPSQVTAARKDLTGLLRAVYIGRLSPRKGPQVAIAAVDELRTRGLDVRLELLGSVFPGYEWFADELYASLADRRLTEQVAFLGFQADIWPVIAAADVVLVPSVADESFGNTAVEAVLAARPVIASDAGGLQEAVEGYTSAQVVPAEAPAAVADAVEKVVVNWPSYRAAAAADAAVAAERHAPALFGDRLERLVLAALDPPTRTVQVTDGTGPK
jgi:glycosyltransferase involved in cell wall biosynthesis